MKYNYYDALTRYSIIRIVRIYSTVNLINMKMKLCKKVVLIILYRYYYIFYKCIQNLNY